MKVEISKTYNPQEVESRWYGWWEVQGIFPRGREIVEARVRHCDAAAERDGIAPHRPHAEQHGSGRHRPPQAHAGFQYALAARNGSRRNRDTEGGRAGTA